MIGKYLVVAVVVYASEGKGSSSSSSTTRTKTTTMTAIEGLQWSERQVALCGGFVLFPEASRKTQKLQSAAKGVKTCRAVLEMRSHWRD